MKEISLTRFKQMTAEEIKESPCMSLTKDGEEIAIIIVGAKEEMLNKVKVSAGLIDASRGK